MKKIDNMTVTTTYHVELKGVEVPDNVYDAILEYDKIDTGTITPDNDYYEALDWIADHVDESNADEVNYEVDLD